MSLASTETYKTPLHIPVETQRTRGRLYIAGPMRGILHYNFPAFRDAAAKLRAWGYEVLSPAEMDKDIYGWDDYPTDADLERDAFDINEALARDLAAIEKCDGVALLPGWETSEGVKTELAHARGLGPHGRMIYEYRESDGPPGFWLKALTGPAIDDAICRNAPPNPALEVVPAPAPAMRAFAGGATRNVDEHKFDLEGFYHPLVVQEFGRYMHAHRLQADGNLRASDNWQKGIPLDVYMKSTWRHFLDLWLLHRGEHPISSDTGEPVAIAEAICALLFNLQGYLYEHLKAATDAAA